MPDRWLMLSARSPAAELNATLVEGLVALGGAAVEESGDVLRTYLAPPKDAEAFVRDATARLSALAAEPVATEWCWRADEDWQAGWRRGLAPRRVGRRLIIAPTWTAPAAVAGDVVIRIDPQMAFGTGEHASTRGVLTLLEAAARPGMRVLDVGAGSGILAIAAVLLGAAGATAVEPDADAIINLRENLALNGVADRVRVAVATVDARWLDAHRGDGWDVIVANVLSGVLAPMLPAFARAVAGRGTVVLGGILEEESSAILAAAARAGLAPAGEHREDGWWSVALAPG
jgi:ribosomal protein L11 methyltransferase